MTAVKDPFEEERHLFQLLIDHPLETLEELTLHSKVSTQDSLNYKLNKFFEQYQCGIRAQVLGWERVGLHPFFLLTPKPFDHPYAIRSFKIIGHKSVYLTQCLTPGSVDAVLVPQAKLFPITKTYPPTNDKRLFYKEGQSSSFADEWLLILKEDMVEREIGDVVNQQKILAETPIAVDADFLDQLAQAYNYAGLGRYDSRSTVPSFIETYSDLVSLYLTITLPSTANYILVITTRDISELDLFVGGFLGRFPVTELYRCSDTLICFFQAPDPNFGKIALLIFQHLKEICTPYTYLCLNDTRRLRLQEQWVDGQWKKFEI